VFYEAQDSSVSHVYICNLCRASKFILLLSRRCVLCRCLGVTYSTASTELKET
jgi:hypothetical protein